MPEAVFRYVRMPRLHDLEVCRRIRAGGDRAAVPPLAPCDCISHPAWTRPDGRNRNRPGDATMSIIETAGETTRTGFRTVGASTVRCAAAPLHRTHLVE